MAYIHKTRPVIVNFGRRVRALRMAIGISQAELGRLSRVTEKFVGQIERGTSNPSLATMVLVADALGCSLTDLIDPDNSPSSITLRADDVRRAREAVAVLGSVLAARRRAKARRVTR